MKKITFIAIANLYAFACMDFKISTELEQFDTLNFFYVDNCYSKEKGSISKELVEKLSEKIEMVKNGKNQKFFLYISNSLSPIYVSKPADSENALRTLSSGNTAYPIINMDKNLIREKLFGNEYTVAGKITFSFFLTEQFTKDKLVENGDFRLVEWLPLEAKKILATNNEVSVEIEIMYNNIHQSIKKEELETKLNYLQQNLSKITFKLTEVN